MARPRRDEQQVLLERIASALAERQSLEPWTLAEIAPAAGLSPAGLLRRFGSRQGVLVALSRRWIDSIPTAPVGPLSPDAELRSWVEQRFSGAGPGVAQGLVNLLDDLVDDDLRGLLAEGWAKEIRYLAALLSRLERHRGSDTGQLATVLFDALNGAMLRGAADPTTGSPTRVFDIFLEVWA